MQHYCSALWLVPPSIICSLHDNQSSTWCVVLVNQQTNQPRGGSVWQKIDEWTILFKMYYLLYIIAKLINNCFNSDTRFKRNQIDRLEKKNILSLLIASVILAYFVATHEVLTQYAAPTDCAVEATRFRDPTTLTRRMLITTQLLIA